jgi:hypothetical protein
MYYVRFAWEDRRKAIPPWGPYPCSSDAQAAMEGVMCFSNCRWENEHGDWVSYQGDRKVGTMSLSYRRN